MKSKQEDIKKIPVVDLFAGPGGLGEGFASIASEGRGSVFDIVLSVEEDPAAHQTLELRSFFRKFTRDRTPKEYYNYLRRTISRDELFEKYPEQANAARTEAWCETLGSGDRLNRRLDKRLKELTFQYNDRWVLIGGPPCQAYSMMGRARRTNIKEYSPENDARNFLYREYLRILAEHKPAVFVMENVKGILSSIVNGRSMFKKILADLQSPVGIVDLTKSDADCRKAKYDIYSLSVPFSDLTINGGSYAPADFIIQSEKYGIPQARHRVILLGVKRGLVNGPPGTLQKEDDHIHVGHVLDGLPPLRSGLSNGKDSKEMWITVLIDALNRHWFNYGLRAKGFEELREDIITALAELKTSDLSRGGEFVEWPVKVRDDLAWWYLDERIGGACNHITREHMSSDLHRYLFAACFARFYGQSPKIMDFPARLLPKHKNAKSGHFNDRFKVQIIDKPSATVTSHIHKDGHYYIHHDPAQCRSLTVREVARLQTFPDNYFFEGSRTQQYIQVGNAVPPMLAQKIAVIVRDILHRAEGV
jgi:DNA (cytosine-5)-methyltransferase 1